MTAQIEEPKVKVFVQGARSVPWIAEMLHQTVFHNKVDYETFLGVLDDWLLNCLRLC